MLRMDESEMRRMDELEYRGYRKKKVIKRKKEEKRREKESEQQKKNNARMERWMMV